VQVPETSELTPASLAHLPPPLSPPRRGRETRLRTRAEPQKTKNPKRRLRADGADRAADYCCE